MTRLDYGRGVIAERARFREILLSSEAIGKERAAIELAVNTERSPEDVKLTLRELPADSPVNIAVTPRRKWPDDYPQG
jgi:hypothetical protein